MDAKKEHTWQPFILDTANDANTTGRPKASTAKLAKARRRLSGQRLFSDGDAGKLTSVNTGPLLQRRHARLGSAPARLTSGTASSTKSRQQQMQMHSAVAAAKVDNSYNTRDGITESITTAGHLSQCAPSPNFMKRGNHRGRDTDRLSVDTRLCLLTRRYDPASPPPSVWGPGQVRKPAAFPKKYYIAETMSFCRTSAGQRQLCGTHRSALFPRPATASVVLNPSFCILNAFRGSGLPKAGYGCRTSTKDAQDKGNAKPRSTSVPDVYFEPNYNVKPILKSAGTHRTDRIKSVKTVKFELAANVARVEMNEEKI